MAALHIRDLAADKIFTLLLKRMGDLGFIVGVVPVAKVPVNPQGIPIGIERNSRERDLVILIHRRGRGGQFQHGRLVALKRSNIHHDIDPGHLFTLLTLRHRRDVKADALLHKGAADHERRIQLPARATG